MQIEQRGVDTVPDEERASGPRDLVRILLGSVIGLLLSLGCTALTLRVGGDAVVGSLNRAR
jgi:hypothetical protein